MKIPGRKIRFRNELKSQRNKLNSLEIPSSSSKRTRPPVVKTQTLLLVPNLISSARGGIASLARHLFDMVLGKNSTAVQLKLHETIGGDTFFEISVERDGKQLEMKTEAEIEMNNRPPGILRNQTERDIHTVRLEANIHPALHRAGVNLQDDDPELAPFREDALDNLELEELLAETDPARTDSPPLVIYHPRDPNAPVVRRRIPPLPASACVFKDLLKKLQQGEIGVLNFGSARREADPLRPPCVLCRQYCWDLEYSTEVERARSEEKKQDQKYHDGPCFFEEFTAAVDHRHEKRLWKSDVTADSPLCKKCESYCWAYQWKIDRDAHERKENATRGRSADLNHGSTASSSRSQPEAPTEDFYAPSSTALHRVCVFNQYLDDALSGRMINLRLKHENLFKGEPCQECGELCFLYLWDMKPESEAMETEVPKPQECVIFQYLLDLNSGLMVNQRTKPLPEGTPVCPDCNEFCWANEYEMKTSGSSDSFELEVPKQSNGSRRKCTTPQFELDAASGRMKNFRLKKVPEGSFGTCPECLKICWAHEWDVDSETETDVKPLNASSKAPPERNMDAQPQSKTKRTEKILVGASAGPSSYCSTLYANDYQDFIEENIESRKVKPTPPGAEKCQVCEEHCWAYEYYTKTDSAEQEETPSEDTESSRMSEKARGKQPARPETSESSTSGKSTEYDGRRTNCVYTQYRIDLEAGKVDDTSCKWKQREKTDTRPACIVCGDHCYLFQWKLKDGTLRSPETASLPKQAIKPLLNLRTPCIFFKQDLNAGKVVASSFKENTANDTKCGNCNDYCFLMQWTLKDGTVKGIEASIILQEKAAEDERTTDACTRFNMLKALESGTLRNLRRVSSKQTRTRCLKCGDYCYEWEWDEYHEPVESIKSPYEQTKMKLGQKLQIMREQNSLRLQKIDESESSASRSTTASNLNPVKAKELLPETSGSHTSNLSDTSSNHFNGCIYYSSYLPACRTGRMTGFHLRQNTDPLRTLPCRLCNKFCYLFAWDVLPNSKEAHTPEANSTDEAPQSTKKYKFVRESKRLNSSDASISVTPPYSCTYFTKYLPDYRTGRMVNFKVTCDKNSSSVLPCRNCMEHCRYFTWDMLPEQKLAPIEEETRSEDRVVEITKETQANPEELQDDMEEYEDSQSSIDEKPTSVTSSASVISANRELLENDTASLGSNWESLIIDEYEYDSDSSFGDMFDYETGKPRVFASDNGLTMPLSTTIIDLDAPSASEAASNSSGSEVKASESAVASERSRATTASHGVVPKSITELSDTPTPQPELELAIPGSFPSFDSDDDDESFSEASELELDIASSFPSDSEEGGKVLEGSNAGVDFMAKYRTSFPEEDFSDPDDLI